MHLPRVKISLSSILFVVILLSMVVAGTAWAQTKEAFNPGSKALQNDLDTFKTNLDDEQANLIKTGATSFKTYGISLGCEIGLASIDNEACKDPFSKSGSDTQANRSIQGDLAYLIGGLYSQPPATIPTYVAYLSKEMNLGIAQPAYAQGIGFSALNPVIEVWKITRNLAYFLLIIVLLIVGFMIMAGKRLGSKTEITAQQAIPSLVITLILITFSYAISGLLIEGMYLIMWLMAGLFQGFGGLSLIQGNVFDIAFRLIGGDIAGQGGGVFGQFISDVLGGGLLSGAVGLFSSWVATVVILLVIAFNTFKLFFSLLRCYIEIILNVAFAPLILLTGALPGQNPFPAWMKSIVGNLAVFPGLLLLFLVFEVLRNTATQVDGGFLPPYLGGTSSAEFLPFLAGLALILALPQAVDEIKKALGANQNSFFSNLVQAGMKNAQERKGLPIAVTAAGTGLALGGLGGAAIGAVNYMRAPAGQKARALRRDFTRGVLAGSVGGAVLGGAPKYVSKPLSIVANFERDVSSLAQAGERVRKAKQQGRINTTGTTPPVGSGGTQGTGVPSAVDDPTG